jgi:L-ornithine N5-oxygenase
MEKQKRDLYDVVGIGFGPANIALAVAAEELKPNLDIRFIEKNPVAGWQEEMLLPESDIQNHPLRDLVTPRNPRSRYTFINFLFENGRLFEHLNLPIAHPLRLEYHQYVSWVAQHFTRNTAYGATVERITPIINEGRITSFCIRCSDNQHLQARTVVLAPGRTPFIPPEFAEIYDERIVHFTHFLRAFKEVKNRKSSPRIAVIGGSQTAVELILHITNALPSANVVGINRNFGFRLKDTSPFSEKVYFPEFVNMFFHATPEQKAKLRNELAFTNYSASDRDVLDSLYVQIYRNKILGCTDLILKHMTKIKSVALSQEAVNLRIENSINKSVETLPFDLVILATGFKDIGTSSEDEPYPSIMEEIAPFLALNEGAISVDYNYRVRYKTDAIAHHAPIYLNGLCESSHGMGDAGSFSLLSLRSAAIVESLASYLELADTSSRYMLSSSTSAETIEKNFTN